MIGSSRPCAGVASGLLYAALVVWLTWPLGANLATHEPFVLWRHLDFQLIAWSLGSQSLALVQHPTSLPHPGIFHPTPWALYYGETAFGALPLFIGPYLVTHNATLAMNLTFLTGIVLTAWSLHAVATRWTVSHLAGFLAAWTFLTTPWVLWWWVPMAPNYAVLPCFPWIIYLAAARPLTRRRAIALGALVVLQSLVSVYIAVAVFGPLAVLTAVRIARRSTRTDGLHLAAVLLASLAPLAVVNFPHVLVRQANPHLPLQSIYARYALKWASTPADLVDVAAPGRLSATTVAVILLGLAAVLYRAASGDPSQRAAAWRSAMFWVLAGLLLSMRPDFLWGEGHRIRLPQAVIEALHIPLYEAVRAPGRLGIAALMGMALASALAFAEVASLLDVRLRSVGLRRARPAARAALFGAVVLTSYSGYRVQATRTELPFLLGNYPLVPRPDVGRDDSAIARLLHEPGGPLLELPVGTRFPQMDHLRPMLRALDHGHPILNGYHGYWPAEFPARMALVCQLPDPESLAALRKDTGLEYILVDLDRVGAHSTAPGPYHCPPAPGDQPNAQRRSSDVAKWQAVLGSGRRDLLLAAVEGNTLLFRVSGEP